MKALDVKRFPNVFFKVGPVFARGESPRTFFHRMGRGALFHKMTPLTDEDGKQFLPLLDQAPRTDTGPKVSVHYYI